MMSRFDGRVALVTGGGSGIGAAITARLLDEGARVAVLDLEPGQQAEGRLPLRADVTSADDVAGAVAATVEEFGRLDAAFAVAGGAAFGTIVDGEDADWDRTVALVLRGVYLTVRHAVRAMREGGRGGAVVAVASLNAHVPMWGGSAYSAGKAGVENLVRSAALESAPLGVRVNAVLPGLVATPLTQQFADAPGLWADFEGRIPVRRAAGPEEVAGPCLYLASDDASYVNGTSLVVDGGWEITNYPDLSAFV